MAKTDGGRNQDRTYVLAAKLQNKYRRNALNAIEVNKFRNNAEEYEHELDRYEDFPEAEEGEDPG